MDLNELRTKAKARFASADEALAAVKQDGWEIQYVHDQTEEICFTAVRQDGYALQFVKSQTEEICLAAVKQDGRALQYVRIQTKEICLAAVKQDGYALRWVDANCLGPVDPCDGKTVEIDGKKYKLSAIS